MIEIFLGWAAWLRKTFELKPGELGDGFAAVQIVSSTGAFILAVLVVIFK